jgi:hypothetical protein
MIHEHFLASRQVEVLRGHGVDKVLGELGIVLERGNGGNAPAFVGVGIFRRRSDAERRELVQEESSARDRYRSPR